ncbi:LPS-assembly protein LptD [Persephonella sp.]
MKQKIIPILSFLLICIFQTYGENVNIPVSIEAEKIEKESEDILKAEGNVVVHYKDYVLYADKIVYDQKKDIIHLINNIKIKTKDFNLSGERGWWDVSNEIGEIYNIKGILYGKYYVKAKTLRKVKDRFYFKKGEFSLCNFDQYDWYFKSSKGSIKEDDKLIAYNLTFRFCGLPLLYTPVFYYPTGSRQSGFLIPIVGQDTYNDFTLKIPFYLVTGRSSDMTVTYDYRNKQGQGVDLEFRYRFSRYSLLKTQFFYFKEKSDGFWWDGRNIDPLDKRWRIYGNSKFKWGDFKVFFNLEIPSDPYFYEDFYNTSAFNKRYISYTKSQLLAVYEDRDYAVEVNFDFLYDLSKPNNEETLQRLPELRFYVKKRNLWKKLPIYFDFLSVNTNFYREKGDTGIRSDNLFNFSLYTHYKKISNIFEVHQRTTVYAGTKDLNDGYGIRNLFHIKNTSRMVEYRKYNNFTHSIIPQISFDYISKVKQDDLPYFDRDDRIPSVKDVDFSLFNILNFSSNDFFRWEVGSGYTFLDKFFIGDKEYEGNLKPVKNSIYFKIKGVSGENTLFYDLDRNQITRSISSLSIPFFNLFTYSVVHSFDKGIETDSLNQLTSSVSFGIKNLIFSGTVLNNLKDGYVQQRRFALTLNRNCWSLTFTFIEDYIKTTDKRYQTYYLTLNILDIRYNLPFLTSKPQQ